MLEVRDLACQRGEQPLFSGISFEVGAGELLWVEGRNGVGKTSLLRILCGLSPAEVGTVLWRNEDIRSARAALLQHCLFLGHANGLKDDLTVAENLQFHARLGGVDAGTDRIDAALRACGLDERRDLAVRYLSQGQRRRAALARLWLARLRDLWILDEPFAALDSESVQRLAAHLSAHLEAGGIAVLTTHQEVLIPAGRTRRLQLDA